MHDESYILGMTRSKFKNGTVGKTKNCSLQFTITL